MRSLGFRLQLRLLVLIAVLQIAGAVVAACQPDLERRVPQVFKGLALPPQANLVPLLAFAAGGALSLAAGREDRRAVYLGMSFLLLSLPFTTRFLHALGYLAPPALGWPLVALRSVHVDAFFPYFFWLFALEFPQAPAPERLRRFLPQAPLAALALGGALLLGQSALFVHAVATAPVRLPGPAAPEKPSYAFYGLLTLATLAAFATLVWRARASSGAERRRVGLFGAALMLGILPLFSQLALAAIPAYRKGVLEQKPAVTIIGAVVYVCLLSVPFTTAYAVLVQHVVNVRLIARQALHYALARYSAMVLAATPMLALLAYLYAHRDQSLRALFSGGRLPLLLSASLIGAAALHYRRTLLDAVDRRFFREQYDARQILTLLVESLRAAPDAAGLANLIAREIDLALHLDGIVALLGLDPRSNLLSDPRNRSRRLDAASPLALLVSSQSEALSCDLEDRRSPVGKLPEKDRHWLLETGFRLMVPILALDGSMLGILGLGGKRSGLPFLKEDRQLLRFIASSAFWVLEREQARQLTTIRRREDDDEPTVNLSPRLGPGPGPNPEATAASTVEVARECGKCGMLYPSHTVLCNACSRRLEPSHVPYVLPGRYRFEKRIGAGGMGVVYKGSDLALSRPVAVKTLRRVSPEDAMRLRREARTAAAVSHPHLAPVYGMETWQGTPMLVLELLEGGTLAHRLVDQGSLSPLETVEMGIAMAGALAHLHTADILHRDIKPSNIGYTRDGTPKLMDFGIARLMFDLRSDTGEMPVMRFSEGEDATSKWNTDVGQLSPLGRPLVGTLSYLSPEALDGEPPDASFDLWSLCIVLYECVLGKKVFSSTEPRQTMVRHPHGAHPGLRPGPPGVRPLAGRVLPRQPAPLAQPPPGDGAGAPGEAQRGAGEAGVGKDLKDQKDQKEKDINDCKDPKDSGAFLSLQSLQSFMSFVLYVLCPLCPLSFMSFVPLGPRTARPSR